MARNKKTDKGGFSGSWMTTFADLVSLLMAFFILLYSISSVDSSKFNMIVKAFASDKASSDQIVIQAQATEETENAANMGEEGREKEIDIEAIYRALVQMIEQRKAQDQVEVAKGEGYVFIRFRDNMLFEPNSAVLKPQDQEMLDFVGMSIKAVQEDAKSINIVGHTAAIPGDPDYAVSDRLLSSSRANTVLMHFEDVIGIDPSKLVAVGYGKWVPLPGENNETEESRSKNRRVEILISSEGTSLATQLENIYEQLVAKQ